MLAVALHIWLWGIAWCDDFHIAIAPCGTQCLWVAIVVPGGYNGTIRVATRILYCNTHYMLGTCNHDTRRIPGIIGWVGVNKGASPHAK